MNGLPTRKPIEDASTAYSNKTLVSNWWEDRHVPGDQTLSSTDRIFARDLGAITPDPNEVATTKRHADVTVQTSPPPAVIKKPSMYNSANLEARLATYGTPDTLHYTLGKVDIGAKPAKMDLQTTNNHFYVEKPQADVTSRPDHFGTIRGHTTAGALAKDVFEGRTNQEGELGARRGEISRNPREAGNPYGVSVYVDEYAKWHTKLAGMPLEESVKRAQTKYF